MSLSVQQLSVDPVSSDLVCSAVCPVQKHRIVIVGAGSLARQVFDIFGAVNAAGGKYEVVGFLDDVVPDGVKVGTRHSNVLGPIADIHRFDASWLIAIGDPSIRAKLAAMLPQDSIAPAVVHPVAWVGGDVELGRGVFVAAGARVTTNVRVGDHSHIGMNAVLSHDSSVGEFVSVSPGVMINGGATVGDGVFLGSSSVVLPGVTVGENAIVGAGAVVTVDVAPGTTVVGVPARCITRVN
jgi:sugar O-acyltransferase (sialic acid O-acetyltransferase NeuD family)